MRHRIVFAVALFGTLAIRFSAAGTRCGIGLEFTGEVKCEPSRQVTVVARTTPAMAPSLGQFEKRLTVSEGILRDYVRFDAMPEPSFFSCERPADCSREPERVHLSLIENGKVLDEVTLEFPRDFKMTQKENHSPNKPIVLHCTK